MEEVRRLAAQVQGPLLLRRQAYLLPRRLLFCLDGPLDGPGLPFVLGGAWMFDKGQLCTS